MSQTSAGVVFSKPCRGELSSGARGGASPPAEIVNSISPVWTYSLFHMSEIWSPVDGIDDNASHHRAYTPPNSTSHGMLHIFVGADWNHYGIPGNSRNTLQCRIHYCLLRREWGMAMLHCLQMAQNHRNDLVEQHVEKYQAQLHGIDAP